MNRPVKKTIAAVLTKLNEPLEIREIELPPLLKGQVLVKILFSGVCRSQLMEVKGMRGKDSWLPHLLGHEGSGVVVSVGEGVTKVKPGDDVILGWLKGAGIDAPGARYYCNNQVINSGRVTTFSNYSIVSESRLVIKPPSLSFEAAVLFGCAIPTGAGMVINQLKPKVNQSVLLLGLGGVGLSALMALSASGVKSIIAADVCTEKLNLAKKLGATHICNSSYQNFSRDILDLTDGGADICIESCGKVETIELGFSLIKRNGGTLLFASHPPEGEMIKLSPHDLISGKKITGSWGGGTLPDIDIPIIYGYLSKAKIQLDSLLTKKYSLNSINLALDDLDQSRVFRPLIVMDHT
jgi:S-(hydroxymethyl)glutathione dehydrogenase/alcohol dehydrogenase